MNAPKRQHVVSKVVLRQWADDGGCICRFSLEHRKWHHRRTPGGEGYERNFLVATEGEFLIGDAPAQTFDEDTNRIGVLGGVPIGDATAILMPVRPTHAIGIGSQERYIQAGQQGVDRLNAMQVVTAIDHLYCRPGSPAIDWVGGFLDGWEQATSAE